jgi:hypothetical protein
MSEEIFYNLHPCLKILIRSICENEKLDVDRLIEAISKYSSKKHIIDNSIAIFCAIYFAQSSTSQGHQAARHGEGEKVIQDIIDIMNADDLKNDIPLILKNNSRLTDHQA